MPSRRPGEVWPEAAARRCRHPVSVTTATRCSIWSPDVPRARPLRWWCAARRPTRMKSVSCAPCSKKYGSSAGITDAQMAEVAGDEVVQRGPANWEWVQGVLRAVDRFVPHGSGAAIALATRDVYQYVNNAALRQQIDDGCRASPDGGTRCGGGLTLARHRRRVSLAVDARRHARVEDAALHHARFSAWHLRDPQGGPRFGRSVAVPAERRRPGSTRWTNATWSRCFR